ncbi:MAG: efflux RND transporter periplasmic adaptor subunit [Pseudomonadota bacterium]
MSDQNHNDPYQPQEPQTDKQPINNEQAEPQQTNTNEQDQDRKERHRISSWKANIQLIIVLLFIFGGIFLSQTMRTEDTGFASNSKTEDLLVNTTLVLPQKRNVNFSRTGNVGVNGRIDIVSQISGRVVKVHPAFNNGGVFKKGDILFEIEDADYINQVNIAKAQVEEARTSLSVEQAESDAAIAEWKSLNPNRPAPDLVARKPQLDRAKAALNAAKAQLSDARLNLDRTKFQYNFDGRIIDTTIELGQFIQAGQNYGSAYPLGALEISVPVEDRILKFMNISTGENTGSAVKIRTQYRGEEVILDGVIDRIGSTLDSTTRFVDVIVQPVDDQWDILVPGVFVEVDLIGDAIENVWMLPNGAMQGQNKIWIVTKDKTLQEYRPQVITSTDQHTFVIGNGQNARVVIGLLKGVSEGMGVRLSSSEAQNQAEQREAERLLGKPPQGNDQPSTNTNSL